jgi:hypothetical protein
MIGQSGIAENNGLLLCSNMTDQKCQLTPVELRVLKAGEKFGAFDGLDLAQAHDLQTLREHVRHVAFHEAAHVVARAFVGHEWGHISHLSIIPNEATSGHIVAERPLGESLLAAYPPQFAKPLGRVILISLLAGRAAERRLSDDCVEILDIDSMDLDTEGSDLFRAKKVAQNMAHKNMPCDRILDLASKWTTEMLELPLVWSATEKLAGLLLEHGTLDDRRIWDEVCSPIMRLGYKLPAWKRRLQIVVPKLKGG